MKMVGLLNRKKSTRWARRESDHLIVLRDGKADHMGKGMTVLRSSQRKTYANLPAGNSKKSKERSQTQIWKPLQLAE